MKAIQAYDAAVLGISEVLLFRHSYMLLRSVQLYEIVLHASTNIQRRICRAYIT